MMFLCLVLFADYYLNFFVVLTLHCLCGLKERIREKTTYLVMPYLLLTEGDGIKLVCRYVMFYFIAQL